MKYNNCGVSPVLGILLRHVRSLISTTNQYFITMYAVVLKMDPPSSVNDEIAWTKLQTQANASKRKRRQTQANATKKQVII